MTRCLLFAPCGDRVETVCAVAGGLCVWWGSLQVHVVGGDGFDKSGTLSWGCILACAVYLLPDAEGGLPDREGELVLLTWLE